LAAGLIGLAAAGVLRAMQIPSLVMTQIVTAIGLLVLPTMSLDCGMGRSSRILKKAVITSAGLTVLAVAFAVVLAVFAKPIEALMFGARFSSDAWLIPLLGLVPVCTGFALGFSIALRGSHRPQFDLTANLISAPLALLAALVFTRLWGLRGAAISLVLGAAVNSLIVFYSFRRWKMPDESLQPSAPAGSEVQDVTAG
jgi:O-antigen/teichoic acid export membrane protein